MALWRVDIKNWKERTREMTDKVTTTKRNGRLWKGMITTALGLLAFSRGECNGLNLGYLTSGDF